MEVSRSCKLISSWPHRALPAPWRVIYLALQSTFGKTHESISLAASPRRTYQVQWLAVRSTRQHMEEVTIWSSIIVCLKMWERYIGSRMLRQEQNYSRLDVGDWLAHSKVNRPFRIWIWIYDMVVGMNCRERWVLYRPLPAWGIIPLLQMSSVQLCKMLTWVIKVKSFPSGIPAKLGLFPCKLTESCLDLTTKMPGRGGGGGGGGRIIYWKNLARYGWDRYVGSGGVWGRERGWQMYPRAWRARHAVAWSSQKGGRAPAWGVQGAFEGLVWHMQAQRRKLARWGSADLPPVQPGQTWRML